LCSENRKKKGQGEGGPSEVERDKVSKRGKRGQGRAVKGLHRTSKKGAKVSYEN